MGEGADTLTDVPTCCDDAKAGALVRNEGANALAPLRAATARQMETAVVFIVRFSQQKIFDCCGVVSIRIFRAHIGADVYFSGLDLS